MTPSRPSPSPRRLSVLLSLICDLSFDVWRFARWSVVAVCCLTLADLARSETIILHLKNGDRLAGVIVSEDTNRVVLNTSWIKELSVPVREIDRREIAVEPAKSGGVSSTNPPPSTAGATNGAPVPGGVSLAGAKPPPPPKVKYWKAEARVGANFLSGAKDQEIFYGRAKFTYERPYEANSKKLLRNVLDYNLDYGRTEGVSSANRMDGSDKFDIDVGKHKFYLYNLAGVGYDEVRKIDLRYEVGPGVGYHLFTATNFIGNVEVGADYQAEERADHTSNSDVYYRLAEDFSWKVQKRITLVEKFEFFPSSNATDYRFRLESTLSYWLWQNLSLNLTLLDVYDAKPAAGVPQNELQIRSSLGVTF